MESWRSFSCYRRVPVYRRRAAAAAADAAAAAVVVLPSVRQERGIAPLWAVDITSVGNRDEISHLDPFNFYSGLCADSGGSLSLSLAVYTLRTTAVSIPGKLSTAIYHASNHPAPPYNTGTGPRLCRRCNPNLMQLYLQGKAGR